MSERDPVEAVRACYSTWSGTYYDEYYGQKASYPPVHRELLKGLLAESGARTLLDAGCGPASFLRELSDPRLDRYGFDVTPEMVAEARRVLEAQGVAADHIWEGSVLSPDAFRRPGEPDRRFDAAVCVGVLPHIPAAADAQVIDSLRSAVKEKGLVVIEARNQLFSLFTLNRPTWEFLVGELIPVDQLRANAPDGERDGLERALGQLQQHFRMDLPPIRKGKAGEPGYDEVLSRAHNPLVLREQFAAAGFTNVRLLFYHYHCLPPMVGSHAPELFRAHSLAMEEHPADWRGYFMASAFLLAGNRA